MPKHVVLFVLMALLAAANPRAQDRKPAPYPVITPVEQYTIASREAEIALARTAAPPSISAAADVLVLGRRGYESAVKGAKMIPVRRWSDGSAAPQPDHNRRSGRGTLCAGYRHEGGDALIHQGI